MPRPRTHGVMTVHVSNAFKAEFQRLASTHGVSESALALRMIEEALRLGVEHQHASLLEAVVQQTIRESIAAHAGRLGDLAQRAALYGDESRRLTLQVLVNAVGVDRARAMRREVHSAAYQRLQESFEPPAPDGSSAWPAARTPS